MSPVLSQTTNQLYIRNVARNVSCHHRCLNQLASCPVHRLKQRGQKIYEVIKPFNNNSSKKYPNRQKYIVPVSVTPVCSLTSALILSKHPLIAGVMRKRTRRDTLLHYTGVEQRDLEISYIVSNSIPKYLAI